MWTLLSKRAQIFISFTLSGISPFVFCSLYLHSASLQAAKKKTPPRSSTVSKATPKPKPTSTPRPTPKPTPKPTPRPTPKPTPSPTPLPTPTTGQKIQDTFVQTNIAVSESIDRAAEGIDLFLAGRKYTRRRNETFVRLENSTYIKEYKDPYNDLQFNASIRLPNFEEYWQLKFTSYDEQKEQRQVLNRTSSRRAPREQNVGASLGLLRRVGNVRASFQPRLEFKNPLALSHSLAFESVAELEAFRINPKFELYADAHRGVGLFQVLNFTINLTNVWDLSLINQGDYEEKLHKYSVTNGVSLGQMLSSTQHLSYHVFFLSVSRPNYHLQNYSVGFTWSEVLLRRILDYQISPGLEFDEMFGFSGRPGITFDINLTF